MRLHEIIHLSLGAWGVGGGQEGGSRGAGRQDTRILHIHTHERSINACVPHSLHSSLHILYEIQRRLSEILRDSAPVCGRSAERGIGGSEAPITRETHPYSLIMYIFS